MRCFGLAIMVAVVPLISPALARAGSHADMVRGEFKSGPEVTQVCLGCHEQQALKCTACHAPKGRLGWKALGHAGNPARGKWVDRTGQPLLYRGR